MKKKGFTLKYYVNKGFTLIEVLLAAGLMAMVLGVASVMFYTVFRSSRKASAIATAKTEGAFALRSMDQMIRFATTVTCGADTLNIIRLNREVVNYSLNGTTIASTSGSLTSSNVSVTHCPSSGSIFDCQANRIVRICFVVNKVGGIDVTDYAGATGTSGVTFQTQVAIRNLGN